MVDIYVTGFRGALNYPQLWILALENKWNHKFNSIFW